MSGTTANGFAVRNIGFDLRGSDLFDTKAILADDIVFSDLSFRGHSMRFDEVATDPVESDLLVLVLEEFVISGDNSAVVEPGTLALFGIGLAGLGYMRRLRSAGIRTG